ncbi:hypothetical protein G6F22_020916 [Rhizopus arrhizus]|nr:hypothetical protein G6F22_020916 [Rhizopus arrhizus]
MGFAGGPGRRGLWRRVPLWRTGGSGAGAPGPERRALRIVYLSDARGAIGPAAALLYGSAGGASSSKRRVRSGLAMYCTPNATASTRPAVMAASADSRV